MHSPGFLQGPEGTIMVKLFAGTDIHVQLAPDTARHLVRLLERFNWTKSDPQLFDSRWRRFWRGIHPIERRIVSLYVQSSNGEHFRTTTVWLGNLPQALHSSETRRRPPRATDGVLNEFANLEQILVRACVDADKNGDVHDEDDLEPSGIVTSPPNFPTSRERVGQGRLRQDRYRDNVLALWNNACAVTGCSLAPVVVASHAKPWALSNDGERLDPHNGLPLVGSLDRLFDAGLIGFNPVTGSMHVASIVGAHDRVLLGLPAPLRRKPCAKQAVFLRYHLDYVFQGEWESDEASGSGQR